MFGNEVGLSPRVQIYTHNHWQDVFEGYAASFGPVTIGDHSYLTGNVMIVPGVTVGRGCTVLANSVVTADLDDRSVASGVPAKVIGRVEGDVLIVLTFHLKEEDLPEGVTVFDFGLKKVIGPQNRYTDEIRNFFRKRGVRFKPYAWRYVHDVGLFNQ